MEEVVHVISTDVAQVTVSGEPKIADDSHRDRGAFVEVLDKHDNVVHRARYETLPITIGNAYRCDHILDSEAGTLQTVKLSRDESDVLKVSSPNRFWAPGGMTVEWSVDPDRA
ncbi:MAG: hypothetical protein ACRDAM_19030, partial [Casimicrobium sp.]